MQAELTALLERAEHLLWVIARSDVDGMVTPRADALRRIQDLEGRVLQLGVTDLYQKILLESARLTKIVL